MAALILYQHVSIADFVLLYDKNTRRLHCLERTGAKQPGYRHFLATAWELSFASIEKPEHTTARTILGISTFLASESIPQALFTAQRDSNI